MNNKYFVKIEKAYEESGKYYVQGVATGTLEDRDKQRMSKEVVDAFARALPLPLTNSHPRSGDISGELGQVIEAIPLNNESYDLFIKGELDYDHPDVPYLIKQIQKGKKFAFSIEGIKPVARKVWSEKLGQMIDEFVSVIPTGISITSQPSYIPSFMEVVTKAYKDTNLNITDTQMDEVKQDETKPVETTEAETITEVVETEVKAPEAETPTEVKAEEVATETVETPVEEAKAEEAVEKSEGSNVTTTMFKSLESKVDSIVSVLEKMTSNFETIEKSVSEFSKIEKSVEEAKELVKSLPMAKRSLVAKATEEVPAPAPTNFKEALLQAPIIK